MESPIPLTPVVEVVRDPNVNSSHVRYVEHCHNRWACPVCSAWLTNQDRQRLDEVLAKARKVNVPVAATIRRARLGSGAFVRRQRRLKRKPLYPVLVTLTLQHHLNDRLKPLIAGLTGALQRVQRQRQWKVDLKAEYGLRGMVRSLEVLYGDTNGWHPHFHVLLFVDYELSLAGLEGLRGWLFDLWLAALQKEGYSASEAHGVDVTTAGSKIAEYVAKWGHEPKEQAWGAGHEMTKAAAKLKDSELLTPFQLLEAYGAGSKRAGALFREYVEAMTGRHQLHGLKQLEALLAAVELPDADPNYTPAPMYAVVSATPDGWKQVCRFDLVPKVTALAALGMVEELRRLFDVWGVIAVVHDAPGEVERDTSAAAGEQQQDASAMQQQDTGAALGELQQSELPGIDRVKARRLVYR